VLGVRADRGAVGTRRSENRSPNHGSLIAGCHASVTSCLETRPQPLDRVRLSPAARLMEMAHPPCALYVVPPDKVAAQRIVPARKGLRR